jgi:hypothetical protein
MIRKSTLLLKGSNIPGKIPNAGDLQLKELAINFADVILYASGTTSNSILPIGWDRVARTGDTMTGTLYSPSVSATTISATTYYGLPIDIRITAYTYSNNLLTIKQNQGQSDLSVLVNTMTGLTVNNSIGSVKLATVGNPPQFLTITNDNSNSNPVEVNTMTTGQISGIYSGTNVNSVTLDVWSTAITGGTAIGMNVHATGGSNNYGLRIQDGSQSIGRFLKNVAVNGAANWSNIASSDVSGSITGFTYNNANNFTLTNNTGGTLSTNINTVTGLTVNGSLSATTISANTLVSTGVKIMNSVISPPLITANTNNYNPTDLNLVNILRLSSDANRNLTGLVSQENGRNIIIFNVGSFNIVLVNESASSTAANRFSTSANATLAPNEGCTIWYDGISSRWRIIVF